MGFINDIFSTNYTSPLVTDKYHLTTAYAYWLEGRENELATFYMFNRKTTEDDPFCLVSGLEGVIDLIKRWQEYGFLDSDIAYLKSLNLFPEAFLKYLKNLKFKLQIDAAPEGTVFFPQEPIMRIYGPIIEVKMLESATLCLMNGHSSYATHAMKMTQAIQTPLKNGSPVGQASIQGLRRGPSFSASVEASRGLIIGGYSSSSTAIAAKTLSIPFTGTMDHAWVMSHEKELGELTIKQLLALKENGSIEEYQRNLSYDAFRSFALTYPNNGIILVDTYSTLEAIDKAIIVIKELRELNMGKNYGIRFDSGDITHYSKIALRKFAEAELIENLSKTESYKLNDEELLKISDRCSVFCAASDNIDDKRALKMRQDGAFIKFWGIGTASSYPATVGIVFKASEIFHSEKSARKPLMKISKSDPQKSSNPGRVNSKRFYDQNHQLIFIVIFDEKNGLDVERRVISLDNPEEIQFIDDHNYSQNILEQIFNQSGELIYKYQLKESFPGSGCLTTDLEKIHLYAKEQLARINNSVKVYIDYGLYQLRIECEKSNINRRDQ